MVRQTGDDIDQVRLWVDSRLAAVLYQGEELRQPGAGRGMADSDPVLGPELQRPHRVLRPVIGKLGFGYAEASLEALVMSEEVLQPVGILGLRGRRDDVLLRPVQHPMEQGQAA